MAYFFEPLCISHVMVSSAVSASWIHSHARAYG